MKQYGEYAVPVLSLVVAIAALAFPVFNWVSFALTAVTLYQQKDLHSFIEVVLSAASCFLTLPPLGFLSVVMATYALYMALKH